MFGACGAALTNPGWSRISFNNRISHHVWVELPYILGFRGWGLRYRL